MSCETFCAVTCDLEELKLVAQVNALHSCLPSGLVTMFEYFASGDSLFLVHYLPISCFSI